MIARRALLAGGLGLPLLAAAGRDGARSLLERAIAAAGGRAALRAARVLRWTGTALVHAGGRTVAIAVETTVEPFVRARSVSWPLDTGVSARRTLVLAPGDAWLERGGVRLPIPDRLGDHERRQFALYGLMRLVDLDGPLVRVAREGDTLRVRHPQAPETLLRFDAAARLIEAENSIAGADDGHTPLRQRFRFEGRMPGPIAWPRRIAIDQNGRRFFELALTRFTAGGA